MKPALMLFAGLLAFCTPALAEDYAGPRELVQAIYQPLLDGKEQGDLNRFYSARLQELFRGHGEQVAASMDLRPEGDVQVDFNPFIEGGRPLLYDLVISEPTIIDEEAVVSVKFHNFDHPTLLTITAKREGAGWKVDDVASTGADEHWLLSWLLTYDVFNN